MSAPILRFSRNVSVACIFLYVLSCSSSTESFPVKERSLVQGSVQRLTDSIAQRVSKEGPNAWLTFFENSSDFFMASDGQLVFPNFDTASTFIPNRLVKMISKIQLRWSNIRIDPLSSEYANIAAVYQEDITDTAGKTTAHQGYFTAIAHRTSLGWKLHNAHWSSMVQ